MERTAVNDTRNNEVKERINSRINQLCYKKSDNIFQPHVCLTCDKFVIPRDMSFITLQFLEKHKVLLLPPTWDPLPSAVIAYYKYPSANDEWNPWMQNLMLSPRAHFDLNCTRGGGFIACKACKISLGNCTIPTFAIANQCAVGPPPTCLLDLTEVELALITPVRCFGYIFTYTGGKQMKLKGTLGYYKVEESSIARGIAHFDVLGLNDNIVVLISGKMTSKQYKRAKELGSIRTSKIIRAVNWLCKNNVCWKHINLDTYVSQLRKHQLAIVDRGTEIEDGNTNVESVESFAVYFPDGTLQSFDGGQGSVDTFRETIEEMKRNGTDIQVRCDLSREAVRDYKDANFVRASLLQFPYGRGGLNEKRRNGNGDTTTNLDIGKYLKHLSMLSQPHFHRPLFILILYNLSIRQKMLKMSCLRLKGRETAINLASGLRSTDVDSAIQARRHGTVGGTNVANNYLSSITAITKAIPHSNEAAKKARGSMESMQHNLGQPTFFCTVTIDDDNSFLMQIFSGLNIDDQVPIDDLTDEVLAARAIQRTKLRLNYPGLAALNFEIMLDILFEEVIGWDLVKNGPTEKEGLFGICKAVSGVIEEQGRTTLHTHFSVWVEKVQNALYNLHHSNEYIQQQSKRILSKTLMSISTTALFPREINTLKEIFNHDGCTVVDKLERKIPKVVDDQKLRMLRHKHATSNTFASCPHCVKSWTYEQTVEDLLKLKVPNFSTFPERTTRRLEAKAIEYQKPSSQGNLDPSIVHAAYNAHFSKHVNSCFMSNKKKRKRTKFDDECRYHLPDVKRKFATVRKSPVEDVWTSWNGSETTRSSYSIEPQRHEYNLFQNVAIKAVSESKMTCNSNVSLITPGPLALYKTKYQTKATQEDEQEEFAEVAEMSRKILTPDRDMGDRTDRSEAIRILLRASHAHNKHNVISATGASFLTRRDERFIFSHKFAWCPLRDMQALLDKEMVGATMRYQGNLNFFENGALNYLCRPKVLEDVNVFNFYTKYDICANTADLTENGLGFIKTDHFDHCSFNPETQKMVQAVKLRQQPFLLKICQWFFPDAKDFNGDILLDTTKITKNIESYACNILMLFLPYRCKADLQSDGSFTKKLRLCHTDILNDGAKKFLQNIQDTRSNFYHCKQPADELQERTVPFKRVEYEKFHNCNESEEDEEEELLNDDRVKAILEGMEEDYDDGELNPTQFNEIGIPLCLSLKELRAKGVYECGENLVAPTPVAQHEGAVQHGLFIRTTSETRDTENHSGEDEDNDTRQSRQSHSVKDVVEVIFNFRERRTSTTSVPGSLSEDESAVTTPANGSAHSIYVWGMNRHLDDDQRTAFEMITASFVLTFHDEAAINALNDSSSPDARNVSTFRRETVKLYKLTRQRKKQLVLFLHGPGGSGKSTVIDLVLEYSKEFCQHLGHVFTSRTIIVTAMSGVAATLILGETTHRAVYLNQKRPIDADQVEAWKDTRMLLVDECSYCRASDLEKLDYNVRLLKGNLYTYFGGLHLVLCGDLRQLPPIVGQPLYATFCPQFNEGINTYIELGGMHRFRDDPKWGRRLLRFRNGCPTLSDIRTINEACVVIGADDQLIAGLRYATAVNRDRDSINTATFEEHCLRLAQSDDNNYVEDAIIVLADDLQSKTSPGKFKSLPLKARLAIWEKCGEDNIKFPHSKSRRMDPALKLYRGCPLMLNENTNVIQGVASGSSVILRHVDLKFGEIPTRIKLASGVSVNAVTASQVSQLFLEHCNTRIQPPTCVVTAPKSLLQFVVKFPVPSIFRTGKVADNYERIQMKGRQFSVLSNTATTGHKLQGATLDHLFVHAWTYDQNWAYVVLSRVRTMKGIQFRHPLSEDLSKYAMPEGLKRMLAQFASTKSVKKLTASDIMCIS
jgi:hypothetical protein